MSDALLTLLRLGLLGCLYAFLAWVIWVGLRQLRTPAPKKAAATPQPTPGPQTQAPALVIRGELLIHEPISLQGHAVPIGNGISIGRAAACSLTIEDTYISQRHADIVFREGSFLLEDQGSTNGTYVNRQRVSNPVLLHPGDEIRLGGCTMEFT